jgi:hypothetical protein
MKFLIFLFLLTDVCLGQTLTANYTPNVYQGGSTPQLQNASIYDTGSNSGSGNVGVNSTNPGQRLDVVGTVRATNFTETGIPIVGAGGHTTACFNGSGQLVSVAGPC